MQLVFFQNIDRIRWLAFCRALPVFVIHDGDGAVRTNRMQLLGQQQIQVFVMFF